jgi:DNA invertase Pin-like site-specific DNA recombinase
MSIAITATPRRHVAIYVRVSTKQQDQRSQLVELKRWAEANADQPIKWYEDSASGKTMERPGWQKLQTAIARGEVCAVVCWRIDRLARTSTGLNALFDELAANKINLVSLKEGLDLSTPAGRASAH